MTTDEIINRLSDIRSLYNCFNESEEPYYRALSESIRIISEKGPKMKNNDHKKEWTIEFNGGLVLLSIFATAVIGEYTLKIIRELRGAK